MAKIEYLVIHCSDTPSTYDVTPADINQWHVRERGWSRVGYQILVQRDGTTRILIPFDRDDVITHEELANGARGFNSNSFHICWAGGKGNIDNRTSEQKKALETLVKLITMLWKDVKVIGHQQINRTKYCPAFNVPKWAEQIGIEDRNIDYGNYEGNITYDPVSPGDFRGGNA